MKTKTKMLYKSRYNEIEARRSRFTQIIRQESEIKNDDK
jgi:hypothetical protein